MFEHRSKRPLSRAAFARRMLWWLLVTILFITASLLIGTIGYHTTEGMGWVDALLNAAMILGGMGPVDPLHTVGGKIFASFYALYCGLFLVVCGGLLLVPVFHRVLHHFHAEE